MDSITTTLLALFWVNINIYWCKIQVYVDFKTNPWNYITGENILPVTVDLGSHSRMASLSLSLDSPFLYWVRNLKVLAILSISWVYQPAYMKDFIIFLGLHKLNFLLICFFFNSYKKNLSSWDFYVVWIVFLKTIVMFLV